MSIKQTKSIFHVFLVFTQDGHQKLLKQFTPYGNWKTHEQAREWIYEYGDRESDYTILEVFRKSL